MSCPEKSPLITPELEAQLQPVFDQVQQEVQLLCIAGNDEKSAEMTLFLKHLVSLSPNLSVRFLSPGTDRALDEAMDVSLLPATGVGGPVPRMIFHGVPGGKEFTAFAAAILNAAGGARELPRFTRREIEKISGPLTVRVCVSLACAHCARLVIHAQRVAWENPAVTAHMIDAGLYPELQRQLKLERVPLTVVNGTRQYPGGKTMLELCGILRKRFL